VSLLLCVIRFLVVFAIVRSCFTRDSYVCLFGLFVLFSLCSVCFRMSAPCLICVVGKWSLCYSCSICFSYLVWSDRPVWPMYYRGQSMHFGFVYASVTFLASFFF
jgi:hypothetical protein